MIGSKTYIFQYFLEKSKTYFVLTFSIFLGKVEKTFCFHFFNIFWKSRKPILFLLFPYFPEKSKNYFVLTFSILFGKVENLLNSHFLLISFGKVENLFGFHFSILFGKVENLFVLTFFHICWKS